MKDLRELWWVASRLLSYPSGDLQRVSLAVDGPWGDLAENARSRLERFLRHVRSVDLVDLQQEYVRTFDLSDRTSLYLTYARHGDGRDRGAALAALKERYRAAGLDPSSVEIPDFLPMVLEFLALAPDPSARMVAGEFASAVADLAARLETAASPYADVVGPVADAFRSLAPATATRWWGR